MSTKTIGFDRELKLKWLNTTVDLVLQGLTEKEILARLKDILEGELTDGGTRGAKGKTITVLLRIWIKVPDIVKPLRDDAVRLIRQPDSNRLVLHWGLCLASYPFFAFVAETIGRLAKLQGNFSPIHIQRRAKEQYGERETVTRSVNRIIQSLADWGVIKETNEKRIFEIEKPLPIKNNSYKRWLIEAVLVSSGKNSAPLKAIVNHSSLFPFNITFSNPRLVEESERLELFHYGLDEEIVTLRK